jgi:hypothetical protein
VVEAVIQSQAVIEESLRFGAAGFYRVVDVAETCRRANGGIGRRVVPLLGANRGANEQQNGPECHDQRQSNSRHEWMHFPPPVLAALGWEFRFRRAILQSIHLMRLAANLFPADCP